MDFYFVIIQEFEYFMNENKNTNNISYSKNNITENEDGLDNFYTRFERIFSNRPDTIENFKKSKIQTRDIFRDIEIDKESFSILFMILFSIAAMFTISIPFSADAVGLINNIPLVVFGYFIGLFIGAITADLIQRRYPPIVLILFSSVFTLVIELLTTGNVQFVGFYSILLFLNSCINGASITFFFILFIENTNILERGRVFALLIFAVSIFIIPIIFYLSLYSLDLIIGILPIISAIYFYRKRNSENKLPKEIQIKNKKTNSLKIFNQIGRNAKNFIKLFDKTHIFNFLVIFFFGIIIGLIVSLEDFESNMIRTEFLSHVYNIIMINIIVFLTGFVFDKFGKRTAISLFVVFIGILNILTAINESFLSYSIVTLALVLILIMLIPLVISEISRPNNYGKATVISLTMGCTGIIIGIGLQVVVSESVGINPVVSFFCILALFFLIQTKESISSKELEWSDALYHLYVVTESGMLIYDYSFVEEKLATADLVSGGIIGLVTMANEITRGKEKLRTIDHGDKKIMFLWSNNQKVIYVLLAKYELIFLRNKLKEFANDFETHFGNKMDKIYRGIVPEDWAATKIIIERHFTRKYLSPSLFPELIQEIYSIIKDDDGEIS